MRACHGRLSRLLGLPGEVEEAEEGAGEGVPCIFVPFSGEMVMDFICPWLGREWTLFALLYIWALGRGVLCCTNPQSDQTSNALPIWTAVGTVQAFPQPLRQHLPDQSLGLTSVPRPTRKVLKGKRCIPTDAGLHLPGDTAFAAAVPATAAAGAARPTVSLRVVDRAGPEDGPDSADPIELDELDDDALLEGDAVLEGSPASTSRDRAPASSTWPVSRALLKTLGVCNAATVGDVKVRVRNCSGPRDVVATFLGCAEALDTQDWEELRAVPFLCARGSAAVYKASELYFASELLNAAEDRADIEACLLLDHSDSEPLPVCGDGAAYLVGSGLPGCEHLSCLVLVVCWAPCIATPPAHYGLESGDRRATSPHLP